MFFIKAVATRLIDDTSYPEFVLCEFTDANGYNHKFVEKWPVVSEEDFENFFPKDCLLGCVIIEEKPTTYIVSTEQPWGIESEEDISVFEISKSQLIEEDWN